MSLNTQDAGKMTRIEAVYLMWPTFYTMY